MAGDIPQLSAQTALLMNRLASLRDTGGGLILGRPV